MLPQMKILACATNHGRLSKNLKDMETRGKLVNTVNLAGSKLSANVGNFTCGWQVEKPHTQFISVTCSLPIKTVKFSSVYAASTSFRIHDNYLHSLVNLPEYSGFLTGNFTCGINANLPAIGMHNCRLLQVKIHATSSKKACNCRQYCYLTASKFTCKLQVS